MYVRGTLCFMLQAKWTPRCPDYKEVQIYLQRRHAFSSFISQDERMSESPVETLEKSPRPPLHLKMGPNMPLTTRKPRGVHCSNFEHAWQFFNIVRNPNITLSNRKRDLNSHITSRSVRIVLPRLIYIPELSLLPRQVSWLHWANFSFEWTSPP